MSEYNRDLLTDREKAYFDCGIETQSGAQSAASITGGVVMSFLAALVRAVFVPSSDYNKSDRRLMESLRMRKYSKFKEAVLRKAKGEPQQGDEKILSKLNKKPFILEEETFDPDKYTAKIYEDYMSSHPELFENEEK